MAHLFQTSGSVAIYTKDKGGCSKARSCSEQDMVMDAGKSAQNKPYDCGGWSACQKVSNRIGTAGKTRCHSQRFSKHLWRLRTPSQSYSWLRRVPMLSWRAWTLQPTSVMTGCFEQRLIGCNKASVTPLGLGYVDIPRGKRMGDRWRPRWGGVGDAWGAVATEQRVDVTIIIERT